jgi:hypothetical protein
MAETKLRKYAVIERLGKMDVDLIDVDLVTATAAIGDNEIISDYVEIANAVSVPGGSGIIQSITLLDDGDQGAAMDLVFATADTDLGTLNEVISDDDAGAGGILGFVTLSNYFDGVAWQLASKTNIGMVIKAAASTKSIYVAAVNRSGGDADYVATDDLHLRIGIVKD